VPGIGLWAPQETQLVRLCPSACCCCVLRDADCPGPATELFGRRVGDRFYTL